jgi:hypothetical protein
MASNYVAAASAARAVLIVFGDGTHLPTLDSPQEISSVGASQTADS